MIRTTVFAAAIALLAGALGASAKVTISTAPTHNMKCSGGYCHGIAPNAVLKLAYEWDNKTVGENQDALLVQFGVGL